jgi:hypothetical protein
MTVGLSCVLNYATNDVASGGLIDEFVADPNVWLETAMELSADAPAYLAAAFASLSAAEQQKLILWLALFSIIQAAKESQVLSGISGALSAVGKINIPSTGLASPDPEKSCTGMEPLTMDSVSFPFLCKFSPVTIWIHETLDSFKFLSFGATLLGKFVS